MSTGLGHLLCHCRQRVTGARRESDEIIRNCVAAAAASHGPTQRALPAAPDLQGPWVGPLPTANPGPTQRALPVALELQGPGCAGAPNRVADCMALVGSRAWRFW